MEKIFIFKSLMTGETCQLNEQERKSSMYKHIAAKKLNMLNPSWGIREIETEEKES